MSVCMLLQLPGRLGQQWCLRGPLGPGALTSVCVSLHNSLCMWDCTNHCFFWLMSVCVLLQLPDRVA